MSSIESRQSADVPVADLPAGPILAEQQFEGPIRLNVAVGPTGGRPVVLLHGLARSWRDWRPVLPDLLPFWSVWAVDQRGHGGSARMSHRYYVSDYVADIGAVLARFEEPVVLVGHSLGALVGLAAGAQWPESVLAIVAENPPSPLFVSGVPNSGYAELFRAMQRLAGKSISTREVANDLANVIISPAGAPFVRLRDVRDQAAIRLSARFLRHVDPDAFIPVLEGRWLEGIDLQNLLGCIRCPVLLLSGNAELGGMLPDAPRMARALQDCTHVHFSGVGHQLHWQDREAWLRAVISFLESL